MPRVLPAVLMAAAAAFPVHAQDWGQLATISSTLGINANRLCVGEGARLDFGCPAYAPYLSSGGLIGIGINTQPSATFHVSGSTILQSTKSNISSTILSLQNNSISATPGAALEFQVLNSNARSYLLYQYSNGHFRFNVMTPEWGQAAKTRYGIYHTSGGGNTYQYWNQANGAEAMRLAHNGNVGISTTNPNAKLEVNGDISATNLRLSGNLYVSGSQTIDGVTFSNGGVSATGIITATSFSGDGSRLTGLASGDRITSGTSHVIVSDSSGVTVRTAGSDRLTVTSAGNVGIGTTAASTRLHVSSSDVTGLTVERGTPGSNVNSNMVFKNQVNSAYVGLNPSGLGGFAVGLNADLSITPWLSIAGTTGYVGIGTSSPMATLQVSGTARITSWTTIAANVMPTTELDVYGTISASNILVNGAPITGNADRITSGTTNIIATQDQSITIATAGTSRVTIGEDGNVGIGTTEPDAALHVSGSVLFDFSPYTKTAVWDRGTSGALTFQNLVPGREGSAEFFSKDGDGTDAMTFGVFGKGTPDNVTNYERLFFGWIPGYYYTVTVDKGGSGTQRALLLKAGSSQVYLATSGNIGIGTTAPNAKLDVVGTISATHLNLTNWDNGYALPALNNSSSTPQETMLQFVERGVRRFKLGHTPNGDAFKLFSFDASGLYVGSPFVVEENAPTSLYVKNNGYVGVGTAGPVANLDVSGTAQIASRTLVGGTGTPSATFQVSGSLLLAGNDNIPCTASVLGLVRRNPTTGRLQACR